MRWTRCTCSGPLRSPDNKTARYFEEEMGRPLCAEIGSIYAAAAEAVNKTEQDFAAIRDELSGRAAQPAQRPRCVLLQL